jgi:DNA-binding transcriptional MerR regulator
MTTANTNTSSVLTLVDVCRLLGAHPWQLRKLYDRKLLPLPRRAGRYRVYSVDDLPLLEKALRKAGYLRRGQEVSR